MSEPDDPTTWPEYSDPRGFTDRFPTGWEVLTDPRVDVAVAALDRTADPWGFRTNVLVTLDDLDRGTTLHAWQEGAESLLGTSLEEYFLIDLEDVHVGERAGIRRLAHHNAAGRAITMEQWTALAGQRGYSLTASVSTLAYPSAADLIATVGASLRVATGHLA